MSIDKITKAKAYQLQELVWPQDSARTLICSMINWDVFKLKL